MLLKPILTGNTSEGWQRSNALRASLYRWLMSVRPAQLADVLKRFARIKRTLLHANQGHQFLVDPVSVFGLDLLRDGVYEPQMTRLLEVLLRADDTFVDVG